LFFKQELLRRRPRGCAHCDLLKRSNDRATRARSHAAAPAEHELEPRNVAARRPWHRFLRADLAGLPPRGGIQSRSVRLCRRCGRGADHRRRGGSGAANQKSEFPMTETGSAGTRADTGIIDAHCHIASLDIIPPSFLGGILANMELAMAARGVRAGRAKLEQLIHSRFQDLWCDELVSEMDAAGIAQSVLLAADFTYALKDSHFTIE